MKLDGWIWQWRSRGSFKADPNKRFDVKPRACDQQNFPSRPKAIKKSVFYDRFEKLLSNRDNFTINDGLKVAILK